MRFLHHCCLTFCLTWFAFSINRIEGFWNGLHWSQWNDRHCLEWLHLAPYGLCVYTIVLQWSRYDSLSFLKDTIDRRLPQKHSWELWNTIQMGYTLVSTAFLFILLLALLFCVSSLRIFPLLLVPALSSFLVSPKGTEKSVAAGHTGGLENILLFRPWCLLCKMCRGGRLV